ncbi:MoaD/ThiS family protein [Ferroplasma sp.]|uniref:MoaD/ThiS family protein n=1 Tax=Ferroplasma sp. TaxID=2591003 RepID=UPI00307CC880
MIEIIGREKQKIQLEKSEKLHDIYRIININEEGFVAILNGTPATSDAVVNPGDNLVFLEIFSGG